jgi:hypothetical protein
MPVTRIRPSSAALWLGLAYAAAVALVLVKGSAEAVWFLPWIVGPAAVAAFGVRFSPSPRAAWAFFAFEAAVIGSTAWLWVDLLIIAPDAQNGIAMMLFPGVQFVAVLLWFAIAALLGWRPTR